MARPAGRSAAEDISAFIQLLREWIRNEDGAPSGSVETRRFRGGQDDIVIDPDELAFELSSSPLEVEPGVLRIMPPLEHQIEDYSEVADLFLIRCLVDAVEPAAEIHLDLSDVWDEGDDFSNQPAELAEELVRKLQVYTGVFSVLSENEPNIRRRAARGEARQLMRQLDASPSADAKDKSSRS